MKSLPKKQSRLLVMHPGALGDLVFTFPILQGLRRQWDSLDLLCAGNLGALAAHLGFADKFFALESARFAGLYQPRIADPRLVDFLMEYEAVLLFSLSELPQMAIQSAEGPAVHRILPRPPVEERVHVSQFICNGLEMLGMYPEAAPPVERKGRVAGSVILHPGSGSPRKNWPLERFVDVRSRLREKGASTRFLLGPADCALRDGLSEYSEEIIVPENLVELAERLQAAGGLIGNDSGVSHLAAFLGVPTVAVFGPSDPLRWRPFGAQVAVVAPADGKCAPCFEEAGNSDCADRLCLKTISVQSVISAFLSLFAEAD
jgi:ADP-heptose:LPS heptosyltransferase